VSTPAGGAQPLHVEITRTGGFAGIRRQARLDAAELSPADADELRQLLPRLSAAASSAAGAPGRGADRFQYDVVVSAGGREERYALAEASLPADLRADLDSWLRRGAGR
jgi:hypothetical protein